jgi:hypothetical protein
MAGCELAARQRESGNLRVRLLAGRRLDEQENRSSREATKERASMQAIQQAI